jgi:hypothetical protein
MSVQPEGYTSTPPPTVEDEAALYKPVLAATRDLSHKFPREHISNALLLIEIQDLARKELDRIRGDINKQVNAWVLDTYHFDILVKTSWTPKPDTPDAYFSRHAGTKPRLILRLAGRAILDKVKKLLRQAPGLASELISDFNDLVLHGQIQEFIERWDNTSLESKFTDRAQRRVKSHKRPRG